VTLVVDRGGQTFLNDKVVDLSELGQQLAQTAKSNPETEVQLRADQMVPYGKIVEVMGAAQKAGLNRIGFVAEAPPSAAAGVKP
jgi:biopolymer transport protein TolR